MIQDHPHEKFTGVYIMQNTVAGRWGDSKWRYMDKNVARERGSIA